MSQSKINLVRAAFVSCAFLVLASCSSEKKPEETAAKPAAQPAPMTAGANGMTSISMTPGEAGGIIEDRFTAVATVTEIDQATRRVTLTSSDGNKTTFIAPPEVRNLAQIRAGDKVTATVIERLVVFVRRDGQDPSATHAAALAAAPKGAKPGALYAESYEITAAVKSIDATTRTATLQFADGQTKSFQVRPDVDLSRYRAGDTVVIRVTEALALLVQAS